MQDLKDTKEIGKFLEGPLAGRVYPSDVERLLGLNDSLVRSWPNTPDHVYHPCNGLELDCINKYAHKVQNQLVSEPTSLLAMSLGSQHDQHVI